MRAELIFVPAPGVGHLVSAVELAKLLARQDHRISINILIIKMPFDYGVADITQTLQNDAPERINFVEIPSLDDTAMAKLMALPRMSFHDAFLSSQRAQVMDVVRQIMNRSEDSRLAVKIKLDYRQEYLAPDKSSELVTAEEIESGIRCLMNKEGDQMRNKVVTMKDLCRKAVVEGGSSRISLTQFIDDVIDSINQRSTST
uniref:UDP-glycosyltransferase n=1 Tax=Daucus carota subsp. sativus TaxID=79200 RepID=A0A166AD02_DAUCS